ncbi:AMP-binding protein, partial [Paenibacillus sepulcri]|nr:AMP-binding protein [Paenibacillus sepulcri]
LGDARPGFMLTCEQMLPGLPETGGLLRIVLDEPDTIAELGQYSASNPGNADRIRPLSLLSPAYVIYTSGSTGKPKGVMISYASLSNFLFAMQDQFMLGERDRLLAVTTIAFDISALEIYLPLLTGGAVAVARKISIQDPAELAELIQATGATVMQATPTLWHVLAA